MYLQCSHQALRAKVRCLAESAGDEDEAWCVRTANLTGPSVPVARLHDSSGAGVGARPGWGPDCHAGQWARPGPLRRQPPLAAPSDAR